MRQHCVALLFLVSGLAVSGSTLEYLSLNEMAAQSTAIVRGTVVGSHSVLHGSVVYTLYSLRIEETWKGSPGWSVDVAVPGGAANGVRQTFAGAPDLAAGADYVVFLWTSKSGLNLIMGLSQGLFLLSPNGSSTDPAVAQSGSSEVMLSSTGRQMVSAPIHMRLSQFHALVRRAMEGR